MSSLVKAGAGIMGRLMFSGGEEKVGTEYIKQQKSERGENSAVLIARCGVCMCVLSSDEIVMVCGFDCCPPGQALLTEERSELNNSMLKL